VKIFSGLFHPKGLGGAIALAVPLALLLGGGQASAHQFPAGCQGVGVSLGLAVFFGEGLCAGVPGNTCELTNPPQQDCAGGQPCISQDATAGILSPCETVVYQGRLEYFGGNRCGISDGVLGITLPNGNVVNVTPAGGIPLLASPGAFVDSNIVAYTVDPNDLDPVTQQLVTTIRYLGVSHASPTNGVASGSIDIFNGIAPCADNTECTTTVCDPEATDGAGRVGLCVTSNVADSTPCEDTDGSVCTLAGCQAGLCDQNHILPTPCNTPTPTPTPSGPHIQLEAVPLCINDTPFVDYVAQPIGFIPQSQATITWIKNDGSGMVAQTLTNQPFTGRLLWPGAQVDAQGNPTAWPGWVFVNGVWLQVPDGLTPSIDFQVEINPTEAVVTLQYPPALPDCDPNPCPGRPGCPTPTPPGPTPTPGGPTPTPGGGGGRGVPGLTSLGLAAAFLALLAIAGRNLRRRR